MMAIRRSAGMFYASIAALFIVAIWSPASAGAAQMRAQPRAMVRFDACPCYSVLHYFGPSPDGRFPEAPLAYLNGLLYGTTEEGGKGPGTIYSVSPSGVETPVHDFEPAAGDGNAAFIASLTSLNGVLYGTTTAGGTNGYGTVYSITPAGVETVLYRFGSGSDGRHPYAGLVAVNGTLYGTTYNGGAHGAGAVFSITSAGAETVLYSFAGGTDGALPWSPLIELNGELYGTTSEGGKFSSGSFHGFGTVFKVTTGGTEKLVHSFGGGGDGRTPYAGLVALNGMLYGTTFEGGTFDAGTVFGMTPEGVKTMAQSFNSTNCVACYPGWGALAVANGVLYGTTMGLNGAIYSVTPAGALTVLHAFVTATGTDPNTGLVFANGVLYGTAASGGHDNRGTVYSLQL